MKQAYPMSVAQRQRAIDGVDPSDSMIMERLDALEEGRSQRSGGQP